MFNTKCCAKLDLKVDYLEPVSVSGVGRSMRTIARLCVRVRVRVRVCVFLCIHTRTRESSRTCTDAAEHT